MNRRPSKVKEQTQGNSAWRGALPLRLLQNSSALRTAVAFGLGGVGYALGNLLLARALPPAQFGVFTLFVALVQIGASLAPIGLEGQVNRRPGGLVSPGRPLLTSVIVAAATAIVASTLYRMDWAFIVALVISITAGGTSHVASAIFRSRLRFGLALTLSQGLAAALLGMGAAAVIAGGAEPSFLAALVAGYYVISASVGWGILARERPQGRPEVHSFLEGLSLLGITAAALILMQLERLLTPQLLTLEDLATFAVVATLVGSPFRMLQMGAGYTLLPRLSTAPTPEERQQLVRREAVAVMVIGGAAALVILFAAPWVAEWLLAGKYELATALMIAALVSAAVKLVDGFATTMVWALGSARQLAMLNWVSWACAGFGVAGAWLGARWGLIGLMYGVTLGWVARGAVAGALSARLLRSVPDAHRQDQEAAAPLMVPNPTLSARNDQRDH
jgi:O-antigen/teichoic acid export membrane protein